MTRKPPVLHGGSQSGHNRIPGHNAGDWPPRPCPECMALFEPKVANQLFCSTAHKADWNNRQTTRGRVLTPLSITARITRDGTRGPQEDRDAGKRAAKQTRALIQQYRDEDRAAGRMPWPEYSRRRRELGLDGQP